jgi:hypothetical protein
VQGRVADGAGVTGEELYGERWWWARLRGIELRSWAALPASIRAVWNERARATA